jgi:hypothetical protein
MLKWPPCWKPYGTLLEVLTVETRLIRCGRWKHKPGRLDALRYGCCGFGVTDVVVWPEVAFDRLRPLLNALASKVRLTWRSPNLELVRLRERAHAVSKDPLRAGAQRGPLRGPCTRHFSNESIHSARTTSPKISRIQVPTRDSPASAGSSVRHHLLIEATSCWSISCGRLSTPACQPPHPRIVDQGSHDRRCIPPKKVTATAAPQSPAISFRATSSTVQDGASTDRVHSRRGVRG